MYGGVERKKQRLAIMLFKILEVKMLGKKPSEEIDKEDFFGRFNFVGGYDVMSDFSDK